jgi:tetratricopeptide (TPR) repeat protein
MEAVKAAAEYFFEGLRALNDGDLNRAEMGFLKALELAPDRPSVLTNLSIVYTKQNKLVQASELVQKALEKDSTEPLYWLQSGVVQLKLGDYNGALISLTRALEKNPSLAEGHNNLGGTLKELNRLDDALASYDRAVSLDPGYAEAHNNRGNALKELNRLDEALVSYDKAISLKPGYAEAHGNRGNALKELNRLDEALASYDKAINLKPDYAEAYSNRGNALNELNRHDEALDSYDKAISLKPDYAEAYSNRGSALNELNRLDEALASYDKAISLKPDYAEAYSNRGIALKELNRLDEALVSYDTAISLKPDYAEGYHNKSLLLLREQRYRDGFSLYQWRWNTKEFGSRPLNTTIPIWDGSSSTRKLLLWAEQGIGDEIFYSSMISLISKEISVTLSADRRLHSLYERSFPRLNLIDRAVQRQSTNSGFDNQAAIGDLGNLLEVSPEKVKQRRYPFLVVSEERTQEHLTTNEFLRERPVCGVAWKSANKKFGDKKSITLKDLEPLLRTKDITFVNLQYGDVTTEITRVADEIGTTVQQARDLEVFNDIDGLLSLIDACDIVLTTSNVTAHLAGAIGKKAAVLVPAGKGRGWYWHDQPQSIWYPSLRLFNQSENGDWSATITEAANWIRENI